MTNQIKADSDATNNEMSGNCRIGLAILQLALGLLLITATALVYSLMPHPAVLIPSLMGAGLLFLGSKTIMACRSTELHDRHHPTTG